VFEVNTDGTGFETLHNFGPQPPENTEGAIPSTGVVLAGNALYGTATYGGGRSQYEGSAGFGTIFAINTNSTGFAVLHSFPTNGVVPVPMGAPQTNSDGVWPLALLLLSGDTLYGTASMGGEENNGTVFAIKTDGSAFTVPHTFTALINSTNSDGANPLNAGLVLDGNILYGTTTAGGTSGNGTLFSISFTPQLTIIPSGSSVIVTWPTSFAGFDYTGYTLQSTTNLVSPVWSVDLPSPVVVNGQYTVTNPISSTQEFFRLSHELRFRISVNTASGARSGGIVEGNEE
jgi:uncharacterized repeat protein (TIGR03803 family)